MSQNPTTYPGTFDTSVYDQENTETSKYTTVADDIALILKEWGDNYHVTRTAETINGMGNVTGITETTFNVRCLLQPLKEASRGLENPGIVIKGNWRGFFNITNLDNGQQSYTPKEGDVLKDRGGRQYRITEVNVRRAGYTKGFVSAFLQSINLEGSQ